MSLQLGNDIVAVQFVVRRTPRKGVSAECAAHGGSGNVPARSLDARSCADEAKPIVVGDLVMTMPLQFPSSSASAVGGRRAGVPRDIAINVFQPLAIVANVETLSDRGASRSVVDRTTHRLKGFAVTSRRLRVHSFSLPREAEVQLEAGHLRRSPGELGLA